MLNFAKVYRNRVDERHFDPPLLKKMMPGCMRKDEVKNTQSCHKNDAKYLQPKRSWKGGTHTTGKNGVFMSVIINILEAGWLVVT
jgi:hypothetical protein